MLSYRKIILIEKKGIVAYSNRMIVAYANRINNVIRQ